MGTSISISFLSAKSLQNCEPPEIHPTHRSRTKEQLIEDAESETRLKLDKLRLRIRELERQKKVLVLCMEQIQNRLGVRITKINKEHDELRHMQPSLQLDDTNVTEEPSSSETLQCVTEITMTEDLVGQTQPPETHAVMDTADSATTNQLAEPRRLDTSQMTNEPTFYKLTDNCTCPCSSLDSCSPQALSTHGVTYCISDMLASCSQPVSKTILVANKSPTSHQLSKRREQWRVRLTKKSTKQQNKSKSNLSSQCVQSGNIAQEELQKRPYACSYDSSFWKKLQFQPVIADNEGKENETAQNQPDSLPTWRNTSKGGNKTTRKEPEIQIQSNNSTTPMPSVPVADSNLKTVSAHTQPNSLAKQQSKSGLSTDEALKSAIDAIRRCPQVKLSVYRLEHLTNTLERQIVYLEALSSFNMYLKAPLIMREVCAKLDPYFLWDWCQHANTTRARDNNQIHRDMLNFLKKKVYCSSLYLRPYYDETTSCNKEVLS